MQQQLNVSASTFYDFTALQTRPAVADRINDSFVALLRGVGLV